MTPQKPPLSDADRADLVAYLDGELHGPAARALEAKLNLDPGVRAEAESLRRTWQLLDYLPQPAPSASFTSKTLDKISGVVPAVTSSARFARTPWAGAAWAAALVLAAVGGFAGARILRPRPLAPPAPSAVQADPDQLLLRDLRVIENKRLYDHVHDIGFLRALANPDDPDLFGEDVPNL
jgi:anti-sigma factor RsiW